VSDRPTTATHTTWCAEQHDADTGCTTAPTRFPALGVTAWMGQTAAGPAVVVDTTGPIQGTPEQIAALAAWLTALTTKEV
jgi:hypothetical protein